jgi:hypothetical protein
VLAKCSGINPEAVLTALREAAIVAFRQQTLLPFGDVVFALQRQISQPRS